METICLLDSDLGSPNCQSQAHYRHPVHPWSGWLLLLPVF